LSNASARPLSPDGIERDIAELAARASLHLRFDRVVLRVVGLLQTTLAEVVPEGQAVLFTVTAPIRRPAKTAAALESLVRRGLSGGEVRDTIHGNEVRLRRVTGVPAPKPRVLGFVHNPESDSGLLLDLAESRLLAVTARSAASSVGTKKDRKWSKAIGDQA